MARCTRGAGTGLRDRVYLSGKRVHSQGRAVRHEKEFAEFRHNNEIFVDRDGGCSAGKPRHAIVGMFKDPAFRICIEHERKAFEVWS